MQQASRLAAVLLLLAAALAVSAAPQSGTVEFDARVTPASGESEPVMHLPFYLLKKSYADITAEASNKEPKLDLDTYVDTLSVSSELKAWMKKNQMVDLSGESFLAKVTPEEILDVPEFDSAFLAYNAGGVSPGFPNPRYHEADKEKNPGKYEQQKKAYRDALLDYMKAHPESIGGFDTQLAPINPGPQWEMVSSERRKRVRRRALELAQGSYLAAKTVTDLQGHARFADIAPGNYWISTLEIEASVGDARARWDVPIAVHAGRSAYVELTNLNAVETHRRTEY